jgi:hypothetical protein
MQRLVTNGYFQGFLSMKGGHGGGGDVGSNIYYIIDFLTLLGSLLPQKERQPCRSLVHDTG